MSLKKREPTVSRYNFAPLPHSNLYTRRFWLTLAIVPLLLPSYIYSQTTSKANSRAGDRVVIAPRTIVIVRRGKLVRDFPEKRRATIKYPVVSGLSVPAVLRRVRALLDVEKVFGTTIAEYRQDGWLEELDYEVNHNGHYILDVTFSVSGAGAYPDGQQKHLAINLKTGRVIQAADAFRSNKLDALLELVKAKWQAALNQVIVDLRESKSDAEEIEIAKEAQEGLEFKRANLDDFLITTKGVTFLYDANYRHAIQALEPDGSYFFSYAELKPYIRPDGPLGQFIR